MNSFVVELSIILLLSLVNGLFAMSELAVMSANRGRLAAHAAEGSRGAKTALYLAENSAQFLATVQIGITLIGIVAGVFGGATLAKHLLVILLEFGLNERVADPLAFVIVVGGITYFSLVLGELVPKQVALSHPEAVATLVSKPLMLLSRVCAPLVWILEKSSALSIRLLPFKVGQRNEVNVDDIEHLISEGERTGEIHRAERDMTFRVFKLDDRPISAFMTTRRDVVWIDLQRPLSEMWQLALSVPHSFFPVAEGDLYNVLGVISIKELWVVMASNGSKSVRDLMRPALRVQHSRDALSVLEQFKKERRQVALVIDEHGGLSGMVTTHDLLEAIVGDLADFEGEEQDIVVRTDGSVLVDATVDILEILLHFELKQPDEEIAQGYHSVGGVLFNEIGRIPSVADKIRWQGLELEVVDMDGPRIDKILVSKVIPRPDELEVKN